MFHQGTPSFRAWLGAFARELPRAPRRLRDELDRLFARLAERERERDEARLAARDLRQTLAESERDRADRLALIHRLQAESAERVETAGRLAAESAEVRAYAARVEAAFAEKDAESAARLSDLERLTTDRRELHAHVARLEAALDEARRERESWLAVLPGLRLRLPGGSATAERLRRLRRRLRAWGRSMAKERAGRSTEPPRPARGDESAVTSTAPAHPEAPPRAVVEPEPTAIVVPTQPHDEFLAWVRFAVPGMLAEPNVAAMDHALARMPVGLPALEIGSFCGLSTVILCHLLSRHTPDSALFSCDEWRFEGQQLGSRLGGSRTVTHDDYRAYVRDTFRRAARAFAGARLPFTIECDSDELFRRWFAGETTVDVFGREVTLGGEIGFCYIDGHHGYEFARRDFENTDRALAAGGFVLFDDSADGSEWEVNRLTREIAAESRYELVSKNPNYMFRKR